MDKPEVFIGTDWLKLETAIETIGDMVAHHTARLNQAIHSKAGKEEVTKISDEIGKLIQERTLCYDKDNNHDVIIKAYTIYGPFLKNRGTAG